VGPKGDVRERKLHALAENLTLHAQLIQPVTSVTTHSLRVSFFIRLRLIFAYIKTRTISEMIYHEVKV